MGHAKFLIFTTGIEGPARGRTRHLGTKAHDTTTRPSRVTDGRPASRVFCAVHMTRFFFIPRNLKRIFVCRREFFPFTDGKEVKR